jgi:hypothetical protein
VKEKGDLFRDTVALTVRGDGVDIPPFFVIHTYKTASCDSGRRCGDNDEPVKGMNVPRMMQYIDHIAQYVVKTSLLLMDQLSSHTARAVRDHIATKFAADGSPLFIPFYLPAKTAFLISPLDMGAIAAFKSKFHKLDRTTLNLKKRSMIEAWDSVSNQSIRNICLNCGIVGEETLSSLRSRFMKDVTGLIPEEYDQVMEFYESWESGQIKVTGADRARGVTFEPLNQLSDAELDGESWIRYGRKRKKCDLEIDK